MRRCLTLRQGKPFNSMKAAITTPLVLERIIE
jgi:hypothetical protein